MEGLTDEQMMELENSSQGGAQEEMPQENTQQEGLSDEEMASLENENPILSAIKNPATSSAAMGASLDQTNSMLDKLLSFGEKALPLKTMDKTSNLLFGSSGKTVGTLFGSAYENTEQMLTGNYREGSFITKEGKPKIYEGKFGDNLAVDTVFTYLELAPGGGVLSKTLRKLPGGEYIAKNIFNKVKKMPENMKAKAIEDYASIFRAGSKDSKALTEKVVPKMVEDGKIVTSMKSLKESAKKQLKTYGEQIDEWFKALPAGAKKEVEPVVKKLQTLKSQYRIKGKDINKVAIAAIDDTIDAIKTTSGEMSINNLRKLRQIWDEHYSVSKGLDDISGYKKKAERVGADAIRGILAKESPELDKLNKTYSFWSNVKKLADYAGNKVPLKVQPAAAKIVGGIVGSSGGVMSGIAGAQVGGLINKAISSPAWKTVSAVYKNKMANYMMSGEVKKLTGVLKRVITIGKNAIEQ